MINNNKIKKINFVTLTAMFCAIAYVVMFVLKISGIGCFLTFDIKDAIIATGSMVLGPLTGIIIAFLVALLEMITVSSTGPWGALMNFVSSAVFAGCASAVYNYMPGIKKKISGAWGGLGVAIIATTVTMMGMNLLITPIYTKMPVSGVAEMIIPLLLPFNLIKTVLNASIVMVIYKPISIILRRSGFVSTATHAEKENQVYFSKLSLFVFLCSAIIGVVCVVLLIEVFGGDFNLFKK